MVGGLARECVGGGERRGRRMATGDPFGPPAALMQLLFQLKRKVDSPDKLKS